MMSPTAQLDSLVSLSDSDLESSLFALVRSRRRITADLLRHLVEVERRNLHLQQACSSLFTYCVEVLRFSEGAAYKHIRGARLVREFPLVLSCIADGSLHLSGLCILGPHLEESNHVELLGAAAQKSKREIEQLVAERFAKPDVPSRIRKLPHPAGSAAATSQLPGRASRDGAFGSTPGSEQEDRTRPMFSKLEAPPAAAGPSHPDGASAPAPPSSEQDYASDSEDDALPNCPRGERREVGRITPLAQDRYKVQFTASTELRDKLLSAQALLRHQIPDADLAQVVDRAVSLLVEKLEARKFGKTRRPRRKASAAKETPKQARSRYIPAHVRRPVAARDGARCSYVAPNGRRCSERGRLEFHHLEPFARGGASVPENLRLYCAAHNAFAAELDFGPGYRERSKPPP
jgi:hypothetical protein